jgi:hypothetical protein
MELWKKHRAYIPMRFVVVEVVECGRALDPFARLDRR